MILVEFSLQWLGSKLFKSSLFLIPIYSINHLTGRLLVTVGFISLTLVCIVAQELFLQLKKVQKQLQAI